MVAMAVAGSAAEAAGQDIGAKSTDGAHNIGQGNVMPVPFVECFFRGLGEAEVHHAAEALIYAVILIRLKQLQGAQDAQLVRALGSELVLAAFAARDRKQQGGPAFAASLERKHAAVFVVGMRYDLHQTAGGFELGQELVQMSSALVLG